MLRPVQDAQASLQSPSTHLPTSAPPPPDTNGKTLKQHVMHAIVASIELSDMKQLVGTPVMCSLLNAWYLQYFNGTTVDLGYLWPTLSSDAGVPFETAALPLVIFQLSRSYHGLDVRLPAELLNHGTYPHLRKQAAKRIRDGDAFIKAFHHVEKKCRTDDVDDGLVRYSPARRLGIHARTPARQSSRMKSDLLVLGFAAAILCGIVYSLL